MGLEFLILRRKERAQVVIQDDIKNVLFKWFTWEETRKETLSLSTYLINLIVTYEFLRIIFELFRLFIAHVGPASMHGHLPLFNLISA